MKVKELKGFVLEAIRKALKENHSKAQGFIKEGNLAQLRPMVQKIRQELPKLMREYEHQITLKTLMKIMSVPEKDKEVFVHLVTDPKNTGGIQYDWDADADWITPAGEIEDVERVIMGHEPKHKFMDPNDFDKSHNGLPPGETMDRDYTLPGELDDPDYAFGHDYDEEESDRYRERYADYTAARKRKAELRHMTAEAFTSMVRGMIQEELINASQGPQKPSKPLSKQPSAGLKGKR